MSIKIQTFQELKGVPEKSSAMLEEFKKSFCWPHLPSVPDPVNL